MTLKPPRSPLRLATRGSQLALWQANYVASLLRSRGAECQLVVLKTTADRVQDRPLHEIGGKGLFIKELEDALLTADADLAVHSLKDMTARLDQRFALPCILRRHQPADLIIFRADIAKTVGIASGDQPSLTPQALATLPALTIGTGSLRRQALLRKVAPQLTTVGIRGNVDTRLRKLAEGAWDAIILAEASIERLAISGLAAARLDPEWFIPCAGQGALAIETRSDDILLNRWLERYDHPATSQAIRVERSVLAGLGGDCNMPFGCYVQLKDEQWQAQAGIYNRQGQAAEASLSMTIQEFSEPALAAALQTKLRTAGAAKILQSLSLPIPEEYR